MTRVATSPTESKPRVRRLREYANEAEQHFVEKATQAGWNPQKRGWPDFFCWHPDKGVICVEVKSTRCQKLKREQRQILSFLAAHGIKCFRYDPISGLIPHKIAERGVVIGDDHATLTKPLTRASGSNEPRGMNSAIRSAQKTPLTTAERQSAKTASKQALSS